MRAYFTDRNVRRMFVLAVFLGLLAFFRHLFLLLVFFVVFERALGFLATYLSAWTKWKFKWCVLIVVVALLGVVVGGLVLGITAIVHRVDVIRASGHELVHLVRHSDLYHRYGHYLGHMSSERLLEGAREHAEGAFHALVIVGRSIVYVLIAMIFSVVFLMGRDELEEWREKMPMDSSPRILLRYLGYSADAIGITIKLQVIVALVNTMITLPVLLALRLPGIPALMALLFVTGLIPVVGGPVAGAVLMTVAYISRGPVGLGVFIASTFVLHKVESYYLTPRLTAKHVKLPGFVLITSLVLFEHAFGIVGVFLSFPCLYVAAKIREGWVDPTDEARDEEETTRAMRGQLPTLVGFRRLKPISRGRTAAGGSVGTDRKASSGGATDATRETDETGASDAAEPTDANGSPPAA